MSKFNNPKALSALSAQPVRHVSTPDAPGETENFRRAPSPAAAGKAAPALRSNIFQRACFVVMCAYFLSGFANEFASRLFHGKSYLSTATVVLLPLLFLFTGKALRGLELRLGKWWLAFGVWLAICAPFSVWKSDTLNLLANYYVRCFILYFVICACLVNVSQLRKLMLLLGFSNFLVVLTCWKYGSTNGARFSVGGSIFSSFSNANELALQLLLGIIVLLFPFFFPGILNKLLSSSVIIPSVIYMLKTGSRGVLLGVVATVLAFFVLTRKRIQAFVIVVPLAILALLALPSATRHRLTNIATGGNTEVSTEDDESALGSQMQREQLFKDSLRITLLHPIFGVGPGEFVVADSGTKSQEGAYASWRQTHNSYTQISSEAGLPGFVLYVGAVLLSLAMSYRLYRRTVGRRGLENCAAVSFCMVLSIVAYAFCTIFDHLAYTGYLPILAGVTAATHFIAQPALGKQ